MAITTMAAGKLKIVLFWSWLAILLFFSIPVLAGDYGSGIYGSDPYSVSSPSIPVASPPAGTYSEAQTVSLSSTGSSIRYSFISLPSDCSAGSLYSAPLLISTSSTLYARACDVYNNSATSSFSYLIIPPAATSTPVATSTQQSSSLPVGSGAGPAVPTGGFQAKISGSSLVFNANSDVKKLAISLSSDFSSSSIQTYDANKGVDFCSWLGQKTCQPGEYRIFFKFYTDSGASSETVFQDIAIGDTAVFLSQEKSQTVKIDKALTRSLSGKIILQVEDRGQAWYVNPLDQKRYYLGSPADAFSAMRRLALGVSNKTWQSFKNGKAPIRLAGRILLKVEDQGKAYYVNPISLKLYYLGRPSDALLVMKNQGLGISNENLRHIGVGD